MKEIVLHPGTKTRKPIIIKTCQVTRRKAESVLESMGKAGYSPYTKITLARVDALSGNK